MRVDGTLLVKRLNKLPRWRSEVTKDNEAYRYFELDLANSPEDMVVVGRVTWIGREV